MTIQINSESACRKAYLNYHCYGNTMNISADEMGQITQRWESKIKSWQATVSNDENKYEFDDSEFETYKEKGKKEIKENTHTDGKADTTASTTTATTGMAGGIAGSIMGVVTGLTALLSSLKGKFISNPFTSAIIGTILLADAITIKAANPNKDEAEACDQMANTEFPDAQEELRDAQSNMQEISDILDELSDEAQKTNEDANKKMQNNNALYTDNRSAYDAIKAKIDSGEELTDEEKNIYNQAITNMQTAGESITTIQDDRNDTIDSIYTQMEDFEVEYDNTVSTMGEVAGKIEFVQDFDEKTKKNAGLVKTGATLGQIGAIGVTASGVQGALTAGLNVAQYVASGVAIGTGIASGILFNGISREQGNYKSMAEAEIDVRKDTASLNTETMSLYKTEIDGYEGTMQGVEDLELESPIDMDIPDPTSISASENPFASDSETTETSQQDNTDTKDNEKPEDKEIN